MSSTFPRALRGLGAFALAATSALAGCSSSSGDPGTADAAADTGGSSSSAPRCTSSGKNAYDTYGEAAFLTVNSAIFANVDAEITKNSTQNLGGSFAEVGSGKPPSTADDLSTFQAKLGAFLVYAYGGPSSLTVGGQSYSGAIDLVVAHTGLGITMDQYNYFVMNIVVPALTGSGVKSEDVTSCFAPVLTASSVVDAVVGH